MAPWNMPNEPYLPFLPTCRLTSCPVEGRRLSLLTQVDLYNFVVVFIVAVVVKLILVV